MADQKDQKEDTVSYLRLSVGPCLLEVRNPPGRIWTWMMLPPTILTALGAVMIFLCPEQLSDLVGTILQGGKGSILLAVERKPDPEKLARRLSRIMKAALGVTPKFTVESVSTTPSDVQWSSFPLPTETRMALAVLLSGRLRATRSSVGKDPVSILTQSEVSWLVSPVAAFFAGVSFDNSGPYHELLSRAGLDQEARSDIATFLAASGAYDFDELHRWSSSLKPTQLRRMDTALSQQEGQQSVTATSPSETKQEGCFEVTFDSMQQWQFRLLRGKEGVEFYEVDIDHQTKRPVKLSATVKLQNKGNQGIAVDGGSPDTSVFITGPMFNLKGIKGLHLRESSQFGLTSDNLLSGPAAHCIVEGRNIHPDSCHWTKFAVTPK